MRHRWRRPENLAIISLGLLVTGCGRICATGTPVGELSCTNQAAATLSGTTSSGAPVALSLEGASVPASGGSFLFLLVGDYLNLQVSSSFRGGAGTYALPSPDVTIHAGTDLGGETFEELSVADGSITVAIANDDELEASGSVTLTDGAGRTFTVAGISVHLFCAYSQVACH